jgi:hypothetical protein
VRIDPGDGSDGNAAEGGGVDRLMREDSIRGPPDSFSDLGEDVPSADDPEGFVAVP